VSCSVTVCCSTVPVSFTLPPFARRTRSPPAAMVDDWLLMLPPSALMRIAPCACIFAAVPALTSWSVAVVVVTVRRISL
jgi:hypothetical protein